MDVIIPQILFSFLGYAVCGRPIKEETAKQCTPENMLKVCALAERHDVSNLIAEALYNSGLHVQCAGCYSQISKYQFQAVFRYEKSRHEFYRICRCLEEAAIPFIPLKGSVIRDYYPKPWMRTSCDIDILVPKDKVDAAASALVKACGYTINGRSGHDISMTAKNGQHLELHFALVEDFLSNSWTGVLENVWSKAVQAEPGTYRHLLMDDMQYFYHIAHMAKHFEWGGCGIRPFLDLWILDIVPGADLQRRKELLEQGGLLQFAEMMQKLGQAWLTGEKLDSQLHMLQDYILTGGVYGSEKNQVMMQGQKSGSKLHYIQKRVLMPYDQIKYQYPALQKHKWLTPAAQVLRWFRLLKTENRSRAKQEFRINRRRTDSSDALMRDLLESVGLGYNAGEEER